MQINYEDISWRAVGNRIKVTRENMHETRREFVGEIRANSSEYSGKSGRVSQTEFGDMIGASVSWVSNIEKGLTNTKKSLNPSLEVILNIRKAFGCRLEWLLGESAEKFSESAASATIEGGLPLHGITEDDRLTLALVADAMRIKESGRQSGFDQAWKASNLDADIVEGEGEGEDSRNGLGQ